MPKYANTDLDVFVLFEKFIIDSQKGKRLQPNGKKVSEGTIINYRSTLVSLRQFSCKKSFQLRIRPVRYLNKREMISEKNYWLKFYKKYTDYLYNDCGLFDNSTGGYIKNIKVFFNYLNKELAMGIGEFHKQFYVLKEEISIFPLMPDELHYLIHDKSFEQSLDPVMKKIKDFFIFGCTVGLRFSDLIVLRKDNVRIVNGQYYLVVRSIKTAIETLVKLPPYAVDIINTYHKNKKLLLPVSNLGRTNTLIKKLLLLAGFTQPVSVTRNRRGVPVNQKKVIVGKETKTLRFCDVASSHTMRRTAITTMLSLGVPEQIVRKISGHSPGSKEFYRYAFWAQTYQDTETEKMFEKLGKKTFSNANKPV